MKIKHARRCPPLEAHILDAAVTAGRVRRFVDTLLILTNSVAVKGNAMLPCGDRKGGKFGSISPESYVQESVPIILLTAPVVLGD